MSVDEIIKHIADEIKEDPDKIKKLFQKYTITKLLTFKADHDELQQKLKSLKDNIKNINQFVIKQYEEL